MNGAPAFHEDFASEHVDPLSDKHQDFDFDAVCRALGEVQGVELAEETREQLRQCLAAIFGFLVDVNLDRPNVDTYIGRRAIAMAWVVKPALFGGASQTQIAALIGASNKMTISPHAAEFSRLFNVRNRGQSHGWNRSKEAPQSKRKAAAPTTLQPIDHDAPEDALRENEDEEGDSDGLRE